MIYILAIAFVAYVILDTLAYKNDQKELKAKIEWLHKRISDSNNDLKQGYASLSSRVYAVEQLVLAMTKKPEKATKTTAAKRIEERRKKNRERARAYRAKQKAAK